MPVLPLWTLSLGVPLISCIIWYSFCDTHISCSILSFIPKGYIQSFCVRKGGAYSIPQHRGGCWGTSLRGDSISLWILATIQGLVVILASVLTGADKRTHWPGFLESLGRTPGVQLSQQLLEEAMASWTPAKPRACVVKFLSTARLAF